MENEMMVRTEFYPKIPRSDIMAQCKHKITLDQLSTLGTEFATVASVIAKSAMEAPNLEGLYRCVFPEGVTGTLAQFRDGSGALGTILNDGKIAGQARWIPAEAAAIPIDPITLAIAAGMIVINRKFDEVKKLQQEIIAYLKLDKESKLEGAVNSLAAIMEDYRYKSLDSAWKTAMYVKAADFKTEAEQNIIFYRKQITASLGTQKLFHIGATVKKMQKDLSNQFQYYQLSLSLFAFSCYLEVILGKNHASDYLNHVIQKIRTYELQYREDYTACYEQLERYSKDSVDKKLMEGAGRASKLTGGFIAKIPVISRGPVDEALIAAGEKVEAFGAKQADKMLLGFSENCDAGVQSFVDGLEAINEVGNQPTEVFFDQEALYLIA